MKLAKQYVRQYPYIYALANVFPKERVLYFIKMKELKTDFVFWPTVITVKSFDKYNKIVEKYEQLLPGYGFLMLPDIRYDLFLFMVDNRVEVRPLKDENNDPALIPLHEFMRCVSKTAAYKKEWEKKIVKGDTVCFTDGPFKNFTGVAIEDQIKDTVKVEINHLFNRTIECEFSVQNITKV